MKQHKFKQRVLGVLKGEGIPGVWLFTDTETKVKSTDGIDKHHFHLGWVFLCQKGWETDSKYQSDWFFESEVTYLHFIQKMACHHGQVTLCGHNVFFDLQAAGFFVHFKRWGWKLEFLYDKGMIFILKVVKDLSSITILSATNWFDCSLAELGGMIKIVKGKVDFDKVSDKQLKNYCYRDTQIVMESMRHYLKFIRDNDLGRFCLTKSSQAFTAYRRRFMTAKIYLHNDDGIHDLERSAYMGGRTEAFCVGPVKGKQFVTLDVNGMYPYVMQKYRYPSKLAGYLEGEDTIKYTELLGK